MRIVTFNVNGLRAIREYYKISSGYNFEQFLTSLNGDIICFQETKVNDASKLEREYALPNDYNAYYAFQRGAKKIGYSGVGTLCKSLWAPSCYEDGFSGSFDPDQKVGPRQFPEISDLDLRWLDGEGRCLITDHQHFILFNVYFPNDPGEDERQIFRRKFYNAIMDRCRQILESGERSIIITGDFNVTLHPIDHCDYSSTFTHLCQAIGREQALSIVHAIACDNDNDNDNELDHNNNDNVISEKNVYKLSEIIKEFYRQKPLGKWFYQLLHTSDLAKRHGLRDAFRTCHPDELKKYTCWNTMVGARGTNHGTRLDTFLVAGPLFNAKNQNNESTTIVHCDISPQTMGSDHCPVWLELNLEPIKIENVALSRNLAHHYKQKRLSDFFTQPKSKKQHSSTIINTDDPHFDTTSEAIVKEKEILPSSSPHTPKRIKPNKLTDFFPLLNPPDRPSQQHTIASYSPEPKEEMHETLTTCKSVQDWQPIFKPKPAPLCKGHFEPCKLLTVNKKGSNRGRKFYACSRGVGPKENSESKCEHFEWCIKEKK